MQGFADTVDAAIDGYWTRAAQVVRFTIEESGRRLIKRSPIGLPETWKKKPPANYVPGQFVSNWNLGVGGVDATVTTAKNIRAVNNVDRIPAVPFGQRYTISNSVPYAMRLEVDGWSRQAPDGMVRLTGLEFDQIFRWATDEAKTVSGPREMHRGGYGR